MEDDGAFNFVDTRDFVAFLIRLGITAADQHDADSSPLVELDLILVEIDVGHALEEVDDVGLQAQHDGLRLGVAHAAVVLDDLRLAAAVDESEEDKALIVNAFGSQAFDGGTDDAVLDLLHPLLCGEGYGRDAAHAAGVQTGVALADALVVLGLGQNLVVLAVGKHEDGALDTAEELLDDDAAAGIAEHAAKHLLQFLLGFVERGQDEHALAGAETVGLQYVRGF